MAKASNKKLVPKGVRLGWASLKEVKSAKFTISLTDVKGVRVSGKARAVRATVNIKPSRGKNFLIP